MPAEWEAHEATWIGWPHHREDWPGKFPPIPWVYGEIARKIATGEQVRIIVNDRAHERCARRVLERVGVAWEQVEFFHYPTDRGWTRDFGPMFVTRHRPKPEAAVIRFQFNGWAKYANCKKDCAVPPKAAKSLGLRLIPGEANGRPVVLEGGSIDVNGRGTLLTTEECLLDAKTQVRNPRLSRESLGAVLHDTLGAKNILWLGKGIAGDDTHGHVDDLCRFVNPRTAVLAQEENPADANYAPLQENRERMQSMKLEDGSKIEVVALPMPEPLYLDGQRLPASYANFYIANSAVLVPTFNDRHDREALGILGELITDRPVVGIHAVDLVWGLGTLHCLTQQQPAVVQV